MPKKTAPRKPLTAMNDAELQSWARDKTNTAVMRAILDGELQAIRAGANRSPRPLRLFWYDTVKTLLSRMGILNGTTRGGKPIDWDKALSECLAEMVRSGETTYQEFRITDGSRQRQPACPVNTTMAAVQMIGAHYPEIICFVEKDSAWDTVEAVATLYGTSAISGKGNPSYACTENIIRQIIGSDEFQARRPESLIILAMTDYDPAGYKIADAQKNQVTDVMRAIPWRYRDSLRSVEMRRVGIEPAQLPADRRAISAYEPKKDGLQEWYQQTGGVDGRPLGLELDVLDGKEIRGLFADQIERLVDLDRRRSDLREAYLDLIAWDLIMPEVEARRQAMIQAARQACWDDILGTPIPGDLFKGAAREGEDWISPNKTRELFAGHLDRVKKAMVSA